ncbi:hypothetical protein [Campylobacter portucalensis]|uniref:hypothetical protein n=1 Tax=Campylobacter portucalensis TaxID=2608384 RepID=UPI0018A6D1BC|nr:hypothetical protein [Campylobacter portucalensis]
MAGTAVREEISKSEETSSIAQAIYKGFGAILAKFEKKGEEVKDRGEIEKIDDVKKALSENFEKLNGYLEGLYKRVGELETALKTSKQDQNIAKNDDMQGVL